MPGMRKRPQGVDGEENEKLNSSEPSNSKQTEAKQTRMENIRNKSSPRKLNKRRTRQNDREEGSSVKVVL